MELPVSKPSGEEISAMKQEQRDTYSDNKQRIINHLRSRGIRPQAIAGIVGNIAVETGGSFDFSQKQTRTGSPTDPETLDYGGYGLFQFDDYSPGQGHRSWYKSYLEKNNKEDSAESQLDYFLDTVYASKGDPNYEYTEKLGSGDAGVLKAYLDTNENPSQISDAIVDRFEKAGIPHSDRRRRAAEETFAELQPSDRTDVDPDAQYIDQPGDIADTGESVSTEDESSPFEYVPFLRHFFAEGGAVPMERQMELFEDGGLKDEGGSIDPVSGNDVPPGSTMKEVRDDIPAQLSEGEFVFPADVVRFIGLEKLMQMRQEAKMGLQTMEDMGQMGNSDEAIIPDDLPFDIYDLDMDMDEEYNTPQEFNQGGAVQQQGFTGIGGYRPPFQRQPVAGYTPTTIPQFQTTPMPGSYIPPQQTAVPTAQRPTELPKFEGFTQKDVDNREYTNSETGEKRVFTFINGQPTIPIPAGFVPSSEYVKPETAKPTQTTVETARVAEKDSDADERRAAEEEAKFGPGGGRLGIGDTIYGVSFEMPKEGFMPGAAGIFSTAFGLATGKPLPSEARVNFQLDDEKFILSGDEYNRLKDSIKEHGAKSDKTADLFEDFKYDGKVRRAKEAIEKVKEEEKRRSVSSILAGKDDDDDYTGSGESVDINQTGAGLEASLRGSATPGGTGRGRQDYSGGTQGYREPEREYGGMSGSSDAGGFKEEGPTAAEKSAGAGSFKSDPYSGGSMGGRAEGGLINKPKPKTKKMKRGGLASKK